MDSKDQLGLLINLARADGEIAPIEMEYIINLGRANNLLEDDVNQLLSQKSDNRVLPDKLSPDQKFNQIFSLIQLMKIDGKIYREEIQYCARVASKLGYSKEAIFELIYKVKAEMSFADMENLRRLIREIV